MNVEVVKIPKDQWPKGNAPFQVKVNGAEVYNRLTADGANREDEDSMPGEKEGAPVNWGPIVVNGGNAWWGGDTSKKADTVYAAIDAAL